MSRFVWLVSYAARSSHHRSHHPGFRAAKTSIAARRMESGSNDPQTVTATLSRVQFIFLIAPISPCTMDAQMPVVNRSAERRESNCDEVSTRTLPRANDVRWDLALEAGNKKP